jgi:hypothetical protein
MDEALKELCEGVAAACAGIPADRLAQKLVTVPAAPVLELLRRAGFHIAFHTDHTDPPPPENDDDDKPRRRKDRK